MSPPLSRIAAPLSRSGRPTQPFPDEPLPFPPGVRTSVPPAVPGYILLRELGRGGMGVVFEALDVRLDRAVALKFVAEGYLSASGPSRLRTEAVAAARLNHPNLVQIYEVGEVGGSPYLALELVRGESLTARLARGPLAPAAAVDLVRTLATAADHAHARGVVHRDLKPGNVLLAESGEPKIADFGLAKFLDFDAGRTPTGAVLGTPHYIAPEVVASGGAAAGPAADVYALGVILYECLTGRPPFDGRTAWELMRRVVDDEPVPPGRRRPGLPRGLDAVCLTALAKDPTRRYPSAAALAADLKRVQSGEAVRARSGRVRRTGRRVRWALAAAGAAAAVGAAVWFARPAIGASDGLREVAAHEQAGRRLLARNEYAAALAEFDAAAALAERLSIAAPLRTELAQGRRAALRGRTAEDLHRLVDRLRFGFDPDGLAGDTLSRVTAAADALWGARGPILSPEGGGELRPETESQVRLDLRDLALLSADLRAKAGAHQAADERLAEAEAVLGADPVTAFARSVHRANAEGRPAPPPPAPGPSAPPGELYRLGRLLLNAGRIEEAVEPLQRAADAEPGGFWPQFTLGVAAYLRDRPADAVAGFAAAAAVARDQRGRCAYHLGLAHAAAGNTTAAVREFGLALDREPGLAAAALNRGLVRLRENHPADAIADFALAERLGYPPAVARYNLALAHLAAGDRLAAGRTAQEAIDIDPRFAPARRLGAKLAQEP